MEQNLQHICNEMDHKAYEFMEFQRAYHLDKADNDSLMAHTTQPFWQSMRLSKRRLASKGLSVDVQIKKDKFSRTVRDERMCMRSDGHHLVGNKAMNVKVNRTFYKAGKKLSALKNKEICSVSLLKTEVTGDRAACPNCGHINTIQSFIDGCDACNAKFTVQDFQTKVSGFSLEENTSGKIKSTMLHNILIQALVVLVCILLGGLTVGLLVIGSFASSQSLVETAVVFHIVLSLLPVAWKSVWRLGWIYLIGAIFLHVTYRKRVLRDWIVKSIIPQFSAGDFYQNLEYKLRNIHLTDRVEEVNVFARCPLDSIIEDYKDVVECDMTALRFDNIQKDSDGYRIRVHAKMRLTEYRRNRILIKYETLNLQLFGRPDVVNKPVAALREYKCPGCGASMNILEGGKCGYCQNSYDYSEFGWVIESYEKHRQVLNIHQIVKYAMTGLFVIIFGTSILFPTGLDKGNVFEMRRVFMETMQQAEAEKPKYQKPDELYDDVECVKSNGLYFMESMKYATKDGETVAKDYKEYLSSLGINPYQDLENGYVMIYDLANEVMDEGTVYKHYRFVVMYDKEQLLLSVRIVDTPTYELEDTIEDMEEALGISGEDTYEILY